MSSLLCLPPTATHINISCLQYALHGVMAIASFWLGWSLTVIDFDAIYTAGGIYKEQYTETPFTKRLGWRFTDVYVAGKQKGRGGDERKGEEMRGGERRGNLIVRDGSAMRPYTERQSSISLISCLLNFLCVRQCTWVCLQPPDATQPPPDNSLLSPLPNQTGP